MARKWSVYRHVCPNGKKYIGITSRKCEDRWKDGHGYRNNAHFHNAILKYGWENIRHEILFTGLEQGEAQEKEKALIRKEQSNNPAHGYNKSSGGEGKAGFCPTEETRNRIRAKLIGRHRPKETREKLSKAHTGKTLSEEHKKKIRESCAGNNAKRVLCLTTGETYRSATEAAKITGISRSGITACCRGESSSCKNTQWRFIDNE